MNTSSASSKIRSYPPYEVLLYLIVALLSSFLIVFLPPIYLLLLLALVGLLIITLICIKALRAWLYVYAATALAVPAFYPSVLGGEFPVYLSNLFFLIGGLIILIRFEEFKLKKDSIEKAGGYLLMTLALSLPFAFWLSGPLQGLQSCLRFFLILQPFFIYSWIRGFNPMPKEALFSSFIKFLLCVGAIAATYGIIDFYMPVPIPHPFADQYIYLQGEKIRRAQGMFYEASSFGNMCAFFLCLSLLLLYSLRRGLFRIYQSFLYLIIGIFTTALFLSYSRGSWANVIVAVCVFLLLQRQFQLRLMVYIAVLVGGFVFLIYQISPEVVFNFFDWRIGALSKLWSDPNFATSGRWETWTRLIRYFADHPWLLLFGIGYKTLPYTNLFGKNLIADNGFMSLAFETGILGLAAFIWLNAAIFKSLHKICQQPILILRLYGAFLFAFWCGEMVQMLTGDIFTYWRNVIVFFALIAAAQQLSHAENRTRYGTNQPLPSPHP